MPLLNGLAASIDEGWRAVASGIQWKPADCWLPIGRRRPSRTDWGRPLAVSNMLPSLFQDPGRSLALALCWLSLVCTPWLCWGPIGEKKGGLCARDAAGGERVVLGPAALLMQQCWADTALPKGPVKTAVAPETLWVLEPIMTGMISFGTANNR